MSIAKMLYPDFKHPEGDYMPIVNHAGDVLVSHTPEAPKGDAFFLLKGHDGRFGFMVFGFGSCSGCDALQGCKTIEELDYLITALLSGVRWFQSLDDCIHFMQHTEPLLPMESTDWLWESLGDALNNWYFSDAEFKVFRAICAGYYWGVKKAGYS